MYWIFKFLSFMCTLTESYWSQWDSKDPWVSCWIRMDSYMLKDKNVQVLQGIVVWRRSLTSPGDVQMLPLDLSGKALFLFWVQDVLEFKENMKILIWMCLLLMWFLRGFVSNALDILQCNCSLKFGVQQYKLSF